MLTCKIHSLNVTNITNFKDPTKPNISWERGKIEKERWDGRREGERGIGEGKYRERERGPGTEGKRVCVRVCVFTHIHSYSTELDTTNIMKYIGPR